MGTEGAPRQVLLRQFSDGFAAGLQEPGALGAGDTGADLFGDLITPILREPFDYTKWQRQLWPELSVEQLSRAAMQHRRTAV